jgi:hypothetical protein
VRLDLPAAARCRGRIPPPSLAPPAPARPPHRRPHAPAPSLPPIFAALPDDLYQIAIMIDELKHEDVQCRLNSMRKLTIIGAPRYCVFAPPRAETTRLSRTHFLALYWHAYTDAVGGKHWRSLNFCDAFLAVNGKLSLTPLLTPCVSLSPE